MSVRIRCVLRGWFVLCSLFLCSVTGQNAKDDGALIQHLVEKVEALTAELAEYKVIQPFLLSQLEYVNLLFRPTSRGPI